MKYTSLHKVITGYLLQRRYPIHFYVEFLIYANRCFSELSHDTLGNVRTKLLPINEYGAVTLPCDFMDYCDVSVPNGQFKQSLSSRKGFTRLNNFDDNGDKIPYNGEDTTNAFYQGSMATGFNTVKFNDKMEQTGRNYGSRGNQNNTFILLRERNEIQVNIDINATQIILEYISDGQESDNATKITPYATATIEAFIEWKHKEFGRSYGEGERVRAQHKFDQQHRILRSRMNPLTNADIKAALNRNSFSSPK